MKDGTAYISTEKRQNTFSRVWAPKDIKRNRDFFSGKLGVIWMLNSFKKCDPEGQQKNFWESRVDLQTGKMVNKRSVAPISTVQSSNSNRKATSLLHFSSLAIQLPPRPCAEHS